jgi:hypothetical protein
MRKMIVLGAISFAATLLVAADNIQPLNVKAGLLAGNDGPDHPRYGSSADPDL